MRLQLPLERYPRGPSPPGETPSQEGLPLGELHPPLTTWMEAADAPRGPLSRRNRASLALQNPPQGPLEPIEHPQQGRLGRSRPPTVAHRGSPAPPGPSPGVITNVQARERPPITSTGHRTPLITSNTTVMGPPINVVQCPDTPQRPLRGPSTAIRYAQGGPDRHLRHRPGPLGG